MVPTNRRIRERLAEKVAETLVAPLPALTPRTVVGPVALPNKATAVIGMRRAGKTTFLHQQRKERLERGVALEHLPYLSFEDEQLQDVSAQDLTFALDEYFRRVPASRGNTRITLCLHEIQLVNGWERFVRRVLDSEMIEVFVSGSSAALLSREIATSLRGRAWEVVIHPFGFNEFLRHRGHATPADPTRITARQRSALEAASLEYLHVGGFPEVQGLDVTTRHRVLQDYVDVTMLRDVVERHRVSNVVALRWMVRHLMGNAGALFSVEKFYASLRSQGLSVSKDTVHQLLAHLEDCFLVRTVWIDSDSERRRMVNPRKTYPIDPGLIPIFGSTGKDNTGHALETIVLLELERRRMSVTYVRTDKGNEVDFLARHPSGTQELIQVCASLSSVETYEREVRALVEAKRQYPNATCRILTLTREPKPADAPAHITFQPVYEWLLLI